MSRSSFPPRPSRTAGRTPRSPAAPLAKLLMQAPARPHERHWLSEVSRDDADRYALEWAAGWLTPADVKEWLDAGAGASDGRGVAALRAAGVPPRAGCLPLHDDGRLRRGGIPLVGRVALGNLSADDARTLLERTGHLPPR